MGFAKKSTIMFCVILMVEIVVSEQNLAPNYAQIVSVYTEVSWLSKIFSILKNNFSVILADQESLNKYCLNQDFSKIGNGICDFEVKYAACYDDAGDCDDTFDGLVPINSTFSLQN